MFPCVDDDIQNCVSRLIYFLIIRKFDTDSPCFLVFFFRKRMVLKAFMTKCQSSSMLRLI